MAASRKKSYAEALQQLLHSAELKLRTKDNSFGSRFIGMTAMGVLYWSSKDDARACNQPQATIKLSQIQYIAVRASEIIISHRSRQGHDEDLILEAPDQSETDCHRPDDTLQKFAEELRKIAAEKFIEGEPEERRIRLKMLVRGVDYASLRADAALMAQFQAALKDAIASAGELASAGVHLELSGGSINVKASIDPPKGSEAAVASALRSSEDSLAQAAVARLQAVPGIDAVAIGDINVDVQEIQIQAPVAAEETGGSAKPGAAALAAQAPAAAMETGGPARPGITREVSWAGAEFVHPGARQQARLTVAVAPSVQPEECDVVLYDDRLEWSLASPSTPRQQSQSVDIFSIAEVDQDEDNRQLIIKTESGAGEITLGFPADDSQGLLEVWAEAIGEALGARDDSSERRSSSAQSGAPLRQSLESTNRSLGVRLPSTLAEQEEEEEMDSWPPKRANAMVGKEKSGGSTGSTALPFRALPSKTAGLGWDIEQALREVFSTVAGSSLGKASLEDLIKTCFAPHIAAELFGIRHYSQADVNARSAQLANIRAIFVALAGSQDGPFSLSAFQSIYRGWLALQGNKTDPLVIHQGPMLVTQWDDVKVRYICVYELRLEVYTDALGAARGTNLLLSLPVNDIRTLLMLDEGVVIGCDHQEVLEFEFLEGDDTDAWRKAIRQMSDATAAGSATAQVQAAASGEEADLRERGNPYWKPEPQYMATSTNPIVLKWCQSLPAQPLMKDVLGFPKGGSIHPRFCMLFFDRLEEWDKPLEMAHGARPNRSILVQNVRGFEILAGSLILNLGSGGKVTMRVRSSDALREWHKAFLFLIAPSSDQEQEQASKVHRSRAPHVDQQPARRSRSQSAKFARQRSIKDALPPERHREPEEPRRRSVFTDRARTNLKDAMGGDDGKRGIVVNTHGAGRQAMATRATGADEPISDTFLPDHNQPGCKSWINGDVSEKVIQKEIVKQDPRKKSVTDRIGGPATMKLSQVKNFRITDKINHTLGDRPGLTSRLPADDFPATKAEAEQRARSEGCITGKVNERSRQSLQEKKRTIAKAHGNATSKITGVKGCRPDSTSQGLAAQRQKPSAVPSQQRQSTPTVGRGRSSAVPSQQQQQQQRQPTPTGGSRQAEVRAARARSSAKTASTTN